MDELPKSFDFTGSTDNIGGDDIDLRSLDMTDTLIGAAMSELTSALGEADTNPYEAYHAGDGGISDITLTTFDSALLMDGNIKLYTEDSEAVADTAFDNAKEMANLMGIKLDKKEAEKKDLTGELSLILANLDKSTKTETEASWLPWQDSKVLDFNDEGELDFVDDENVFTEEDFNDEDTFIEEYAELNKEAERGEWDYILNRKTLTPISKEPNIRLVHA